MDTTTPNQHFDVLIVGAGLSGIGAGYHLQQKCPGKTFAILEGRDCIGGTWDLFRYPGVRSDSDMFTLGLLVPAVDRAEGDRRWAVDSELRPRDCR
jgi:monooxygenase